jgi:cobalamin biosynthesis Co2+ chelatase CbiK
VLIEVTILMLMTAGKEQFKTLLNNLILPHRWTCFQDPIMHLCSYFFSDFARLIMVGPILIYQLGEKDFLSKSLRRMCLKMGLRSKAQVLNEILLCWIALASVSVRIFAAEVESYGTLDTVISNLAKQLVKVLLLHFIYIVF